MTNFYSIWRDWIDPRPTDFAKIYEANKTAQETVQHWIDVDVVENSLWRYGFPRNYELEIEEINSRDRTITYTDLITLFARLVGSPRYLELGVATGKNFYQVSRQLSDAFLAGVDIENINPRLEALYSNKTDMWEAERATPFRRYDGQLVEKRATLTQYDQAETGNKIWYISGDKFAEEMWHPLTDCRFNLVFSDACHEPRSLHTEIDFMMRFGIIDDRELVMLWDDLGAEMTEAFFEVVGKLTAYVDQPDPYVALFTIPGTYGGRAAAEGRLHKVGLFVTPASGIRRPS